MAAEVGVQSVAVAEILHDRPPLAGRKLLELPRELVLQSEPKNSGTVEAEVKTDTTVAQNQRID
jgi:hypothetical protein